MWQVKSLAANLLGTLSCGVLDLTAGDHDLCFAIGVVGNSARIVIPDGSVPPSTGRARTS